MQIDQKRLHDDIDRIKRIMNHSCSKDIVQNNIFYLLGCDDLLKGTCGEEIDFKKMFISSRQAQEITYAMEDKVLGEVQRFIQDNCEELLKIFSVHDETMDKMDFLTYPYPMDVYSYDEAFFKDIILAFYSTFGNDYYKMVKKYFDENRVGMCFVHETSSSPAFYYKIPMLKSGYVVSKSQVYNTWSLCGVVHEFGHAIDAETLLFPQGKKMNISEDLYSEVFSLVVQRCFTDFLIDKNVDVIGGRLIDNETFLDNYGFSKKISCAFPIKNATKKQLKKQREDILNLDDSVRYFLGHIISCNLINLYRADPKEFMQTLLRFSMSRRELNSLDDAVEKLGIDIDSFYRGDAVINEMIDNQGALKLIYHEAGIPRDN